MSGWAEFFKVLMDSGLLTAAFIIGAVALIVALVGKIPGVTPIELSGPRSLGLALLGLFMIGFAIVGFANTASSGTRPEKAVASQPTAAAQQPPPTQPVVTISPVECIHPQELARQKGWTDKGWTTDKWGGWYVELSQPDELPPMWEALGERHIYQTDTDRTMSPGRWAIYTPYACRDQFGFSH